MPTPSPKKSVTKTTKSTKTTKRAVKSPKKTAQVSSKSQPSGVFGRSPYAFLAIAVVVAAALVAIALALASYHRNSGITVAPNQAALYVRADNQTLRPGSTIHVNVYETGGAQPVNAVQSDVNYPYSKLNFASVTDSTDFPRAAATDTSTPGLIRVARSIGDNMESVEGTKLVTTLNFTVKPDATGAVSFRVNPRASLVVRSTDNKNILQLTPSTSYRITK